MGVARSRILARYLGFHFSQPFRFADFLEMLIGEPVADRLQSNLNRGRKGPYSKPYFYISDGFMNFNHFTFRRNLFLGTPKNSARCSLAYSAERKLFNYNIMRAIGTCYSNLLW
jgi:hypothetical protein